MDWVFPDEIRGWLSEEEGRKLAELARGKRVLEIGSFCGRSTVCMGQTAGRVTCIDPFDGRSTPIPGDTLPEWQEHIGRYGLTDKCEAHRGTSAEVAPNLAGPFDLVFIDGAHTFDAVGFDIAVAERLLTPGGLIVFHDYKRPIDPPVTAAVDAYLASGATLLEVADTLAVVAPPRALPGGAHRQPRRTDEVKPLVFLGMPSYDGKVSIGTAEAYFLASYRNKSCHVGLGRKNSSFLTRTFNDLWCAALNERNRGATHFAMIHADIVPDQHNWLDILLGELTRLDADLVCAVSPIKSEHGWTSTALQIDTDDDPWLRRRLTMKEVYDLPETFSEADTGAPLLLNTGLWVCRLDRPWCEQVCFDVFNRIFRDVDGLWRAQDIPEDWLLSAALNRLGAKIYATRKVTLGHEGNKTYATDHVWGTQERDEVFHKIATERGLGHADQVHEGLSGEGDRVRCETDGGEAGRPERQPELHGGADGGSVGGVSPALHQSRRGRRSRKGAAVE